MDFYANQHVLDTPDALPSANMDRREDHERVHALLHEASNRAETLVDHLEQHRATAERSRYHDGTDSEAVIISG